MPNLPPLAIYIHWPFCKAKCPYCDFNSHVREQVEVDAWRQALLAELAHFAQWVPGRRVQSIFFGGGTPSLMPPAIANALIEAIHRYWPVENGLEITLEANPTSVEAEKFAAFRAAGVNRVSLGVQSLRQESLAFLGREHTVKEALAAVELAAQHFPRYTFDLIYALPGQTAEQWEEELEKALAYARGHLSLYQLTVEENTAFHHAHRRGDWHLPEDDTAARMFEYTQARMQQAGMPAYEISNHALPGQESRHNLAYWRGYEYVGVGPGAHGRLEREPGQRLATATVKSPERWLEAVKREGHGLQEVTELTALERQEERVLMGMRMAEGLPLREINASEERLRQLVQHELLELRNNYVVPTLRGKLLLTRLTAELLS